MTDDLHSPTTAGPTPEAEPVTTGEPAPGTPGAAGAAWTPPGAAKPSGLAEIAQRPEAQLGAAFAGGVVAAILLRRFSRV